MNLLLFGATGMVGTEGLHQALDDGRIERVTSVGRRPTGVVHNKLHELQHADFTNFETIESELAPADACIYCLGVYQGAVPTAEFWHITCDYLAALIRSLSRVRPGLRFCLMSAEGADVKERLPFLFARAKGRAERYLLESALHDHYIFRPGYIDPGRVQSRSRVPAWVVKPVFRFFPSIGIEARALARVMVDVAADGGRQRLYRNADLRRAAAAL